MPRRLCYLVAVVASFALSLPTWAQPQAYQLVKGAGVEPSIGKVKPPVAPAQLWQQLLNDAAQADVVIVGELHNHSVGHWWQWQLLQALYAKTNAVTLSLEMLEADDQVVLDEYLAGQIKSRNFEQEVRLWPNYAVDYKPAVEFCKEKKLAVVAANVPRRYAAAVAERGPGALAQFTGTARAWLPQRALTIDTSKGSIYAEMLGMSGHMGANMAYAQALKDLVMAERIAAALQPGKPVLHLSGAFHSRRRQGIVTYLQQIKPQIRVLTIHMVAGTTPPTDDVADYYLLLPTDGHKSH